jgi:hypothetical protein
MYFFCAIKYTYVADPGVLRFLAGRALSPPPAEGRRLSAGFVATPAYYEAWRFIVLEYINLKKYREDTLR